MSDLLKKELSKILIKNNIINRYSKSPLDRGGAENYLRGCGVNWSVSSDKILEDLVHYIEHDQTRWPFRMIINNE